MKILSVGMMVCDTLLSTVPSNILELDSVSIQRPAVSCGGDALNVAGGLAKLGIPVSIIGRIADDANGRYILEQCAECGIDASGVIYDKECATASSYALIDESGERHFLSEKSIFEKLSAGDIPDDAIIGADIIYFGSAMAMKSMDAGGIKNLFARAHQYGKRTAMDAAINREDANRNWMDYLSDAFLETDIFFPSREEAEKITGKKKPEEIAECFKAFSMSIFGMKLGDQGCFVTDFKENRYIAPPKGMPVVDTTGAGDSFIAGMLCGISHGWDCFTSAGFATSVAARNIGAVGGTAGIPNFEEALRFYQICKKSDQINK